MNWQIAALVIGFAEILIFSIVFFSPRTIENKKMISDNLFDLLYFRVILSILVVFQELFCLLYCLQYRKTHSIVVGLSGFIATTACVGWVMVVSYDPINHSPQHNGGAGIFMVSMAILYITMLRLAYVHDPGHWLSLFWAEVALVIAFIFTVVYVALFFASDDSSWVWENLGFLISSVGYTLFFWNHTLDPLKESLSESASVEYPLASDPLMGHRFSHSYQNYK